MNWHVVLVLSPTLLLGFFADAGDDDGDCDDDASVFEYLDACLRFIRSHKKKSHQRRLTGRRRVIERQWGGLPAARTARAAEPRRESGFHVSGPTEGRAFPVMALLWRCLPGLVPDLLPGLDLRSPTVGADFGVQIG